MLFRSRRPATNRRRIEPQRASHPDMVQGSILLLLVAGLLAGGCSSASTNKKTDAEGPEPIGKLVEATNKPAPIGKLLAELDMQMRSWNNECLTAQTAEDRTKARLLEKNLIAETHKRRAEITEQLESGPLNNRVIAASALGFTHEREALSPLLAALDDSSDEVVGNALLGLMLLEQKDTPLAPICRLMQSSRDDGVRRNAAQCLAALVYDGDRGDCVLPAARLGLADTEPAVRSQCCMILATLVDPTSVQALCDRLYDETPLVVAAAARAVSYLGTQSMTDKGACARALAKSFSETRGLIHLQLHKSLVELSGSDHGKEPEEWIAWATRLP